MAADSGGGLRWLSAHLHHPAAHPQDIYGASSDAVLRQVVRPLVVEARRKGWLQRFFFVRYSEDSPHVRLRLEGVPDVLEEEVRPLLLKKAQESPGISEVRFAEYEGEVERYGGPQGLRLSEQWFHDSSEVALALLRKIDSDSRPSRLGKGLLCALVLLYGFLPDPQQASHLARVYGRNYLKRLVPDAERQELWMQRFESGYDRQSDRLAAYVEAAWQALEEGASLPAELDLYRRRLRPIQAEARKLHEEGLLKRDGQAPETWLETAYMLVPSYFHMMSNRLGVTIQEESYLSVLIHLTLGQEEERQSA